jgi:nicotinamide-nucleotide amidase
VSDTSSAASGSERDEGDDVELAGRVHAALLAGGLTVSTAESLTGGLLGGLLTSNAGTSDTYRGGVVSYATDVKVGLLGVSAETVEAHGVVSSECAAEMASGARVLLGSDWALSTTGVAGPTLQEDKPPGTVHVALAGPDGVRTEALRLSGDRAEVRRQTCRRLLTRLLEALGDVQS